MALITMKDISFTYSHATEQALTDVNLTVEPGLLYGVVGRNLSGKSTLCSLMRGVVPFFHEGELTGEVSVFDTPLTQWDPGELSRRIGYVFQNPFTQISGIKETVFEEIALGLENTGVPRDEMFDRVAAVIDELGITAIAAKNPNGLSGGQRQKVAFASILAMDLDFLVIDEPTSQLDPESSEEVFAIIRGLKDKGTSIVLAEHKIDLLAEYADRIIVMDHGTVSAEGPTREVLTGNALDAAGVNRPEVAEVGVRLAQAGRPLEQIPVTLEEATSLVAARRKENS